MKRYVIPYECSEDYAYRSGVGLDARYSTEYADLSSTPRSVTDLALTIHETGKLLVGRLFPDWKDYYANGRIQRNLFGSRAKAILVEHSNKDKTIGNRLHIGSTAINLIAGDIGLRFGIDHCELTDRNSLVITNTNWFHISQYRVNNARNVVSHSEGELTKYLDDSDVAERTSLVNIYAPSLGQDGSVRIERHQLGQGSSQSDSDATVIVGNTFSPVVKTSEYLRELAGGFLTLPPVHYSSLLSRLIH